MASSRSSPVGAAPERAAEARDLFALLRRRIRRLATLPPHELATTFRATVVLIVVEVLIRSIPLPRLSRFLGVRVDLTPPRPGTGALDLCTLPPGARRQLDCTRRVADAWPFSRGPCLRRALVGGHLLRRFDPTIRIGVADTEGELLAHAWLEIDGSPLEPVSGFTPFQRTARGGAT